MVRSAAMVALAELADALYRMNPWWKGLPGVMLPPHRRHLVGQIRRRLDQKNILGLLWTLAAIAFVAALVVRINRWILDTSPEQAPNREPASRRGGCD